MKRYILIIILFLSSCLSTNQATFETKDISTYTKLWIKKDTTEFFDIPSKFVRHEDIAIFYMGEDVHTYYVESQIFKNQLNCINFKTKKRTVITKCGNYLRISD